VHGGEDLAHKALCRGVLLVGLASEVAIDARGRFRGERLWAPIAPPTTVDPTASATSLVAATRLPTRPPSAVASSVHNRRASVGDSGT
jgi:hypothetical protein